MHDPMTVAFEIKRPWREPPSEFFREGYRPTWVTIWHVDPERGGSDDSCGYSYPRVDAESKWFQGLKDDVDSLCRESPDALRQQRAREGYTSWWTLWLNRASYWHRCRPMSPGQLARFLFGLSFPGDRDDGADYVPDPERFAWIIARVYLKLLRPWYRHPRWHFWHWKVTIEPLQQFKRWAFSRCCTCGGRFAYGEAPTTDQWYGKGPRWFRGEASVYHGRCGSPVAKVAS